MFHGQGTRTTVGEPCSVPSRRNRGWLCNYGPIRGEPKIRSCHFRFCNCSTLISLSRQADRLLPLRNLPIGNRSPTFNVLVAIRPNFPSTESSISFTHEHRQINTPNVFKDGREYVDTRLSIIGRSFKV